MPPDGVIEPVDVSGDGVFGLLPGLPGDRPDQLRLDGLEEGPFSIDQGEAAVEEICLAIDVLT